MNDILRTLRLGIIDLLGVTVPGLILLFLLLFGCIAPSVLLFSDVVSCQQAVERQAVINSLNASPTGADSNESQLVSVLRSLPPVGHVHSSIVLAIILILAYVIGYTLRLSSPDILDKKSTPIVLGEMEKQKKGSVRDDFWPIRLGEEENKFPYWHFSEYLKHRKHDELAEYVKWNEKMRSKTCVNKMKLETSILCPQLSAIIESNEAHIRLLFGTWSACRVCLIPTVVGVTVSVLGIVLSLSRPNPALFNNLPQLSYVVWGFVTLLLFLGTIAVKKQIEKLFHYRRVRELFDVVACYHLACKGFDAAGCPKKSLETVANKKSNAGQLNE